MTHYKLVYQTKTSCENICVLLNSKEEVYNYLKEHTEIDVYCVISL